MSVGINITKGNLTQKSEEQIIDQIIELIEEKYGVKEEEK